MGGCIHSKCFMLAQAPAQRRSLQVLQILVVRSVQGPLQMSVPSPSPSIIEDNPIVCLACGDLFTPHSLAEGALPILFSCGHTVCVPCAEAAALSLLSYAHKWACGMCFKPSGGPGAVNAGLVALIGCSSQLRTSADVSALDSSPSLHPSWDPGYFSSPFQALIGEAYVAIASILPDIDRVTSSRAMMREEFAASRELFISEIDALLRNIIAHRDTVLADAARVLSVKDKALRAQADELGLRVSLLRQAVDVCNAAVAGSLDGSPAVYQSVQASVKGLGAVSNRSLAAAPSVLLSFSAGKAMTAIESLCAIKEGVSAITSELSGPGLEGFIGGGADEEGVSVQNCVSLVCKDCVGDVVPGVNPLDVTLYVVPICLGGVAYFEGHPSQVAGCSVQLLDSSRPGEFRWVYAVDGCDNDVVDVEVHAYGARIARDATPVWVSRRFFGWSSVLCGVPLGTVSALDECLREWLPGAGKPSLLFRMSRDGTTASAFHSRCDGRGSTVTLITSSNGFVFGGYAGAAWNSSGTWIPCPHAFLFTVTNPHGIPPTRYPVFSPEHALIGDDSHGPFFGGHALFVGSGDGSLTSPGETPFVYYTDTTGRGALTFTGARSFVAAEVEVWKVIQQG